MQNPALVPKETIFEIRRFTSPRGGKVSFGPCKRQTLIYIKAFARLRPWEATSYATRTGGKLERPNMSHG